MSNSLRATYNVVRRRLLLFALFVALVAGGSVICRHFSGGRSTDPLNPLGISNLAPGTKYVGDQACTSCHRSIAQSYARTAMARSWRRPENTDLIEDYSAPQEVVDEVGGFRYQVYREGNRFFQREYRVNEQGDVTHNLVREVAYVLGSGTKGRTYVTDSGGYLTIMPVAWYSESGRWDLNPGYQRNNQRFSREVGTQCINCHNSYADCMSEAVNRYRKPLPEGIGCERCHGPGELHVKRESARLGSSTGTHAPDSAIVNPARLPVELQQDVCLQCHLTTIVSFTRHDDSRRFQPGQPLKYFRANFVAAGKSGETFTAVSHGSRTAISRCFAESQGRMTCVYCHDPHVPTKEVSRGYFNSRCTSCHQPAACARSSAQSLSDLQRVADQSSDCIACHMPREKPKDIEHTVTTDHWIRRQPVAALMLPTEEAPGRFMPLVDFFQAAELGEQGIAHLVFGGTTGRTGNMNEGALLLRQALDRAPDDIRWRCWLGLAMQRQGRNIEAAGFLDQAWQRLQQRSDDKSLAKEERLTLQFELAQLHRQLGQQNRGLEVVNKLLEAAPDYMPGYELAADFNMALRRHDAAMDVVRAGLERDPSRPRLWIFLAWTQLEVQKNPQDALLSLKRAVALDPLSSEADGMLAKVYEALGQKD